MIRREFCWLACRAASGLGATALAACATSPTEPIAGLPSVTATTSGNTVSVTVDGVAALSSVGAAALVRTSLGAFLIARTAADSFTVLSAICTHQGCTVEGLSGGEYICPCHGSAFSLQGAVLSGPANRPLQQFTSQFDGAVLTFSV